MLNGCPSERLTCLIGRGQASQLQTKTRDIHTCKTSPVAIAAMVDKASHRYRDYCDPFTLAYRPQSSSLGSLRRRETIEEVVFPTVSRPRAPIDGLVLWSLFAFSFGGGWEQSLEPPWGPCWFTRH
jgi:hypothetical protein